jgi:hypothetical protein
MEHKHESNNGTMNSKTNIAFIVFLLIGAYFLVTEHWAHLVGWLPNWPYLLLLACPLMHLFMHGGHGAHGGHDHEGHGSNEASKESSQENK